jgi:hypothetical protein
LGIGPIPNPQSPFGPIPNPHYFLCLNNLF